MLKKCKLCGKLFKPKKTAQTTCDDQLQTLYINVT